MNKTEVINKINNGREKIEAAFVFAVWNDPERYDDFAPVNSGKDKTLISTDAQFYWQLGRRMYEQGFRVFDAISIDTFLTNKAAAKAKYDSYGGYSTVKELKSLTKPENIESYYDEISKRNSLIAFCTATEDMFAHLDRFQNATNADIYNAIELLNNSIALDTGHEAEIKDLYVTEDYINDCMSGENMGLSYGENCPILNYTTLGLPFGDCYLVAGHSGAGKTSFIFENMAVPIAKAGTKVAIFSNEMQMKAYQNMLTAHILTSDLDYWELNRKKIKIGKYTDKDLEMLRKAVDISHEKYKDIKFVKIFSNDTGLIMKYIKKLAHLGYQCFFWDTFKGDDVSDGSEEWAQLLKNSRKIFNLVSKLNVCMVMTFQLALHTTNQRFLDASCLAGSKQIKEVLSELIMFRKLWSDEYTGEKYDCQAFNFNKENKKIKEMVKLNPDATYVVAFVNKTRNDDGDYQILYQWKGHFNQWKEIGYCTIRNDHKGAG